MTRLALNGVDLGEFAEDQIPRLIADGQIDESAFYWREGMSDWRPITEIVVSSPLKLSRDPDAPTKSDVNFLQRRNISVTGLSRSDASALVATTKAEELAKQNAVSPKQLAYLRYLGVKKLERFDKVSASAEIDRIHRRAKRICFRRLQQRIDTWPEHRMILHPDLYRVEVVQHIQMLFGDTFRTYVRSRVVGASEKLSHDRIVAVINSLCDDLPDWWQKRSSSQVFFDRLGQLFPGCVDGRPPSRSQKATAQSMHQSKRGCFALVVALAGLVPALLVLLLIR